ncbi:hypothetical protein LAZ67_8002618 [Cordylochernes scorpioides]|uniref:Uncharacterized protein n=1 Tax=Cordylochernes scorpioides TaxID=51811 RepID=A0ABY6KR42_9ARAC|nr:hypothetical protein LAZ67_8002618 [Cordylochernes scorpioides]
MRKFFDLRYRNARAIETPLQSETRRALRRLRYSEARVAATQTMQVPVQRIQLWTHKPFSGLQYNAHIDYKADSSVDIGQMSRCWDKREDCLSCEIPVAIPPKITKRSILSCLAKIYDPIGFLNPILIKPKILWQKVWIKRDDQWDLVILEIGDKFLASAIQLGICWNKREDCLSCEIPVAIPPKITKRSILSCLAQIYDPIGFLNPILIKPKIQW